MPGFDEESECMFHDPLLPFITDFTDAIIVNEVEASVRLQQDQLRAKWTEIFQGTNLVSNAASQHQSG